MMGGEGYRHRLPYHCPLPAIEAVLTMTPDFMISIPKYVPWRTATCMTNTKYQTSNKIHTFIAKVTTKILLIENTCLFCTTFVISAAILLTAFLKVRLSGFNGCAQRGLSQRLKTKSFSRSAWSEAVSTCVLLRVKTQKRIIELNLCPTIQYSSAWILWQQKTIFWVERRRGGGGGGVCIS
jgi:hypothetical protein